MEVSDFELKMGIAKLVGYQVTTVHDTVYHEQPVKTYGWDCHQEFNPLDGSLGSKAFCRDLMDTYSVTYYPKRDFDYRYGKEGPYARCGSHEPFYCDDGNRAILTAVLMTYKNEKAV